MEIKEQGKGRKSEAAMAARLKFALSEGLLLNFHSKWQLVCFNGLENPGLLSFYSVMTFPLKFSFE